MASKAAHMLPADTQPNRYNRSSLVQAVARIAQCVGPDSFDPNDNQLVGIARPTVSRPDVYASSLLIGPRSNVHHWWLQPLTYVEAAVAYDLGRSTVLGPRYTVNFHPDTYSSGDRELMRQDLQRWRPTVFAAAVQSAVTQPPLTYDCLEARKLADRAVTSAARLFAQSLEHTDAGAVVTNSQFRGCTRCTNGTHRAKLYESVKQSSSRPKVANSNRSSNKQVFHYRTYDTNLKAAVARDAMNQALGRPADNFSTDVGASAVPAMKLWMDLNRLRLTVEQEEWAAKAKAAMLNLRSDDREPASCGSIGDMQRPRNSRTSGKKGALATSIISGTAHAAGGSTSDMQRPRNSGTSGKKGALATNTDSGSGRSSRRRSMMAEQS